MLRIYQRMWQVNWAEQWQYRANLLMYLLFWLVSPIVFLSVWTTVANSQGAVQGLTANDFSTYYLTLLIVDSFFLAALAVALGTAVFLAASGHAPLLRHRLLVWLGSISYPLYLLHENIGWSLQLRLAALGVPTDAAVLITLASSLSIASAVSSWVERPAMLWIRNGYRKRLAFAR